MAVVGVALLAVVAPFIATTMVALVPSAVFLTARMVWRRARRRHRSLRRGLTGHDLSPTHEAFSQQLWEIRSLPEVNSRSNPRT
jgi:hypothetical protein